jgi:hypothetical protein
MRISYSSPNVGIVIISKPSLQLFNSVGCGLLEKGINCRWFNRKSRVQDFDLWSINWQFFCVVQNVSAWFFAHILVLWCYLNEKVSDDLAPGTDESDENDIVNSWAKSYFGISDWKPKTLGNNNVLSLVRPFFRFLILILLKSCFVYRGFVCFQFFTASIVYIEGFWLLTSCLVVGWRRSFGETIFLFSFSGKWEILSNLIPELLRQTQNYQSVVMWIASWGSWPVLRVKIL